MSPTAEREGQKKRNAQGDTKKSSSCRQSRFIEVRHGSLHGGFAGGVIPEARQRVLGNHCGWKGTPCAASQQGVISPHQVKWHLMT